MAIFLAAALAIHCNAHPVFALHPVLTHVGTARDGKTFHAFATLAFRIEERSPSSLTSSDPGLLAHVRGHRSIAQRVAHSSIGTIRAAGVNAAQARATLRQTVEHVTSDAQKELDREEHLYDSVTNYGAAQSQGPLYGFPGGPDAHDSCAQP